MRFLVIAFLGALFSGSVCLSEEKLTDYFPVRNIARIAWMTETTYLETDGCLLSFRTYRGGGADAEYVSKVSIQPTTVKTDPQDVIVVGEEQKRPSLLIAWQPTDEVIALWQSENAALNSIYEDEFGPMNSAVDRLSTQELYDATKRLAARMQSGEAGEYVAKNYRESHPDRVNHVLYFWVSVFDLHIYVEREKKDGLIAAMDAYKKANCTE